MVKPTLRQEPDLSTPEVLQERKVPGFGKHPETGAAARARPREAGLAPAITVLTDDEADGARLIQELGDVGYDGVVIGSFISGQDPELPPTEQATHGPAGSSTSSTPTRRPPGPSWSATRVTRCPRSGACPG
jgi:hypothetical protein